MGFTEIRGPKRERGGLLDDGDGRKARPGQARHRRGWKVREMETEGLQAYPRIHAVNLFLLLVFVVGVVGLWMVHHHRLVQHARYPSSK